MISLSSSKPAQVTVGRLLTFRAGDGTASSNKMAACLMNEAPKFVRSSSYSSKGLPVSESINDGYPVNLSENRASPADAMVGRSISGSCLRQQTPPSRPLI
jgi:hypothetical protein